MKYTYQILKSAALLMVALLMVSPATVLAATPTSLANSALVSPQKGLFLWAQGFKLGSVGTNWVLKGQKKNMRYQDPKSKDTFLSILSRESNNSTSLEAEAKKWMREYSQYGFDVLGARNFTQSNAKGIVVDLFHASQKKQVRQAVFMKNKKTVVLTCVSPKNAFDKALPQCNQIIRNFSWADAKQIQKSL